MGLKNDLQNKDVYFDTNIFIYLLEGIKEFLTQLSDIQALIENNQIRVFSSDLAYGTSSTSRKAWQQASYRANNGFFG